MHGVWAQHVTCAHNALMMVHLAQTKAESTKQAVQSFLPAQQPQFIVNSPLPPEPPTHRDQNQQQEEKQQQHQQQQSHWEFYGKCGERVVWLFQIGRHKQHSNLAGTRTEHSDLQQSSAVYAQRVCTCCSCAA